MIIANILGIQRAVYNLRNAVRGGEGGKRLGHRGITEGGGGGGLKSQKVLRNFWMTPKSKFASIGRGEHVQQGAMSKRLIQSAEIVKID